MNKEDLKKPNSLKAGTKHIPLHQMTSGRGFYVENGGDSVENQMRKILDENQNYEFVELVYHPDNCINTIDATLIVRVKSEDENKIILDSFVKAVDEEFETYVYIPDLIEFVDTYIKSINK